MKKTAEVNQKVCVACGVCVNACPRGAVSIDHGCYAVVDAAQCVGCGLCRKACPASCIAMREEVYPNEEKALV